MITQISQGAGGGGVDTDEKSKVSSNDTTAGYLNGKLVAGTNVTFTENNDGGNETLTIAAAGGVTGFTGSQNTASPNNTVNASRLLVDAASTNADAVLQPKGTGAVLAQLPDSTTTGGNKRGANAVDLQTIRSTVFQVASGAQSVVTGGSDNRASGQYSSVLGGSSNHSAGAESTTVGGTANTSSGTRSTIVGGLSNSCQRQDAFIGGGQSNIISTSGTHQVIAGGQSNIASASHAAIAGGIQNTSSGLQSFVGGGTVNVASGSTAVICGGDSNTASGTSAIVLGGFGNNASQNYSTILGGQSNTASQSYTVASGFRSVADTYGMRSHASGRFAANGDAQVQEMVVRAQSTSSAQVELTADAAAWSTSNTMQVPTDGALAFDILMVARRADANNECAAWTIRGCIDNNAGTVAFVGTPTTTSLGDDSAGAWSVAADTEAGSVRLRVLAVGQTGKTINWVAHIRATRVVG